MAIGELSFFLEVSYKKIHVSVFILRPTILMMTAEHCDPTFRNRQARYHEQWHKHVTSTSYIKVCHYSDMARRRGQKWVVVMAGRRNPTALLSRMHC